MSRAGPSGDASWRHVTYNRHTYTYAASKSHYSKAKRKKKKKKVCVGREDILTVLESMEGKNRTTEQRCSEVLSYPRYLVTSLIFA